MIRAPVPAYQAGLALAGMSAIILMLDRPPQKSPPPRPPNPPSAPAPSSSTPITAHTVLNDIDASTFATLDPNIL